MGPISDINLPLWFVKLSAVHNHLESGATPRQLMGSAVQFDANGLVKWHQICLVVNEDILRRACKSDDVKLTIVHLNAWHWQVVSHFARNAVDHDPLGRADKAYFMLFAVVGRQSGSQYAWSISIKSAVDGANFEIVEIHVQSAAVNGHVANTAPIQHYFLGVVAHFGHALLVHFDIFVPGVTIYLMVMIVDFDGALDIGLNAVRTTVNN
ncbi:hypothetical protein BpHYR1_047508 [Brachionus plicatilis]|uniref:Uncharacterized protein n=1 Tax=Brachionus plicatilis TaxID=10195 RepID=A0A3M7PPR6_BRAPC|nr:hypothetical protein BpHYR1_047508 [Brachionus plicatilis]